MTERLSLRPHPFPAGHALADYGLSRTYADTERENIRAIRARTEPNPLKILILPRHRTEMETDVLSKLSKEQLEELVRTYARNMLALDGVWFQSVERELGNGPGHEARRAGVASLHPNGARRIKGFLQLPDRPGLDGLERAFAPLRGIRQPAGRTDTGKRFPDIPCGRLPGTVCASEKGCRCIRVCP